MTEPEEMADFEARAEKAYAALYDAAPHTVKDCCDDASLYLSNVIKLAKKKPDGGSRSLGRARGPY